MPTEVMEKEALFIQWQNINGTHYMAFDTEEEGKTVLSGILERANETGLRCLTSNIYLLFGEKCKF